MNFYDVLAAEKWDGGIPTMNFFDWLFAKSMGGNIQWETYEGTLPATLDAKSANMRQYQIYGNTGGVGDDSGTAYGYKLDMLTGIKILQSPEIEQGVWDAATGKVPKKVFTPNRCRSKNSYPVSGGKIFYDFKTLKGNIAFVDSSGISLGFTEFMSGAGSVDVPANAVSCLFTIAKANPNEIILPTHVYTEGIWASIGATITPIYIGNEPLNKINNYADYVDYKAQKNIRTIKKYVLTGNENWEEIAGSTASRNYFRWVFAPMSYCVNHTLRCSHFTQANITTSTTNVGADVFGSSSVRGEVLAIRPENMQSTALADFTAWLAEQYAAGTPVTVWCVLTTAEETDPPVPLPVLPTLDGTTIVDYAGSGTAPEKVYFEYQGGKQS
jgi:hypothetical protein